MGLARVPRAGQALSALSAPRAGVAAAASIFTYWAPLGCLVIRSALREVCIVTETKRLRLRLTTASGQRIARCLTDRTGIVHFGGLARRALGHFLQTLFPVGRGASHLLRLVRLLQKICAFTVRTKPRQAVPHHIPSASEFAHAYNKLNRSNADNDKILPATPSHLTGRCLVTGRQGGCVTYMCNTTYNTAVARIVIPRIDQYPFAPGGRGLISMSTTNCYKLIQRVTHSSTSTYFLTKLRAHCKPAATSSS